MNCRKFQRDFQMKYFDRNLSVIEQEQLQRHLDSCKDCRDCFTDLKEILESLSSSTPMCACATPHSDLPRRIMERLKQAPLNQAPISNRTSGGFILRQIPVLLLLLMTIILGFNLWNARLFDLVDPAGQIINRCLGAVTLIQNTWIIINRLFPAQIAGVMAQFQWISLLIIGTAFILLARNVVLKLKNE